MTTTDERRLDELTEQQDDEVLTAEEAAALAASAELRRELERLLVAGLVALEALGEDADHRGVVSALRRRMVTIRVDVAGSLEPHLVRALELGTRQAFAQLGYRPRRRDVPEVDLPTEVRELLREVDGGVRGDLQAGAALLLAGDRAEDIEAAFARARQGVTRAERAATWGVNRSVAEGVTTVAEQEQASRLWVGERDACLHCLAYFGRIAGPGASFPAGLTFGDRALSSAAISNPPLHPHCRCRVSVWLDRWSSAGGQDYPSSLQREAQRSVARGWSLTSESQASRLRAAERLLRAGAGLPKSVEEYAERAVRRGAFPRGRTFPG